MALLTSKTILNFDWRAGDARKAFLGGVMATGLYHRLRVLVIRRMEFNVPTALNHYRFIPYVLLLPRSGCWCQIQTDKPWTAWPVIPPVNLTSLETRYTACRCQYRLSGNGDFSLDISQRNNLSRFVLSKIISILFCGALCLGLPDQQHHEFKNHPGLD